MLRFLTVGAVLAAFASAAFLYVTTLQTRMLEADLRTARAEQRELAREIATLRAERAFLARPDRIGPLARQLGMRPALGSQFVPAPNARQTAHD
ncbi:MAG: cell division protein FtsL [Pseudomonadota bacterium]